MAALGRRADRRATPLCSLLSERKGNADYMLCHFLCTGHRISQYPLLDLPGPWHCRTNAMGNGRAASGLISLRLLPAPSRCRRPVRGRFFGLLPQYFSCGHVIRRYGVEPNRQLLSLSSGRRSVDCIPRSGFPEGSCLLCLYPISVKARGGELLAICRNEQGLYPL